MMERNEELERRSTCQGCGLKLFLCELSQGVEAITCVNEDCMSLTLIRDVREIDELRSSVRRYEDSAGEQGSELQMPDQTSENNRREQGADASCNLQTSKKKRKKKRKRESGPGEEENAKKAKITAMDLEVEPKRDESKTQQTKKKKKKKLHSTPAASPTALTTGMKKSKETPVKKKKKKSVTKPVVDNDTKAERILTDLGSTAKCSESNRRVTDDAKEKITEVAVKDGLIRPKLKKESTPSMDQTSDTSDVSFQSMDATIKSNRRSKKKILTTDELANTDTDSSSSLGTFLDNMARLMSGNSLASNQLSSECSSSSSTDDKQSLETSSDSSSFTNEKIPKCITKQNVSSKKKVNDADKTDKVLVHSTEKESASSKPPLTKKKRRKKKKLKQVADDTSNDSSSSSLSVAQTKEKRKLKVVSSSAKQSIGESAGNFEAQLPLAEKPGKDAGEATSKSADNLKVESSSAKKPAKDAKQDVSRSANNLKVESSSDKETVNGVEEASSRSANNLNVKSSHLKEPVNNVTDDAAMISRVMQDLGCSSGSSNDMTLGEVFNQQPSSQVAGNGDMQTDYYNLSFLSDLDIGDGYDTCLTTSAAEDALVMINESDLVSPCRFSSLEQLPPHPYQQHLDPPLSLEEMVEVVQKQTSPVKDNSKPKHAQVDLNQPDQEKQSHLQEEPVQVKPDQSESACVPIEPVKTLPNQSQPVNGQVDPVQIRLDQSEPVIAQVDVVKIRQDQSNLQSTVKKPASPVVELTHQSAKHSKKRKTSLSKVVQKKQHQEALQPSATPMQQGEQISRQVDEASHQQALLARQKEESSASRKETQQTPQRETRKDASGSEIPESDNSPAALAKAIADCRNDTIRIDDSDADEVAVSIAPHSSIFSSRGMYQWMNESNLCWLDVIMTAFVNSYQVRRFINSRPRTRRSSIYQTLCLRYDEAQQSGTDDKDDDDDDDKEEADIDERLELLTSVRDEVVETLKRKMKIHVGQMHCAFRMFRHFLKLDPNCTVRDLFTCTVVWTLECDVCGYEERRKMSHDTRWSGMLALPNMPLDFHLFTNAYYTCMCCKQCKTRRLPMRMKFDRLGPLLSVFCKEGFRTFNTKDDLNEGKFDGVCRSNDENDGAHYHVYAVIVQVEKHFVLWLRDFKRKRWAKLDDYKDEYTLWRKTIRFDDDNPKERIVIVIWQRSDVTETKAPTTARRARKTDFVDLTVGSSGSENSNDNNNRVDNHKATETDSGSKKVSSKKGTRTAEGRTGEEEEEKPSSIEEVVKQLERKRSRLEKAVDATRKIQPPSYDDFFANDGVSDDQGEEEEDLLDTGITFGENDEEEFDTVDNFLSRGDKEDVKVRVRNDRPKPDDDGGGGESGKVTARRSKRCSSRYKPGSLNENSLLGQEALDHFRSPNNVYRPTVAMKNFQKKLNLPATPPDRMMEFVYDGGNKKRTKTDLEKFYERNPPVDVVGGLDGKRDWISEHHFRKIRREHRPVDLFNYKDKDRFLKRPVPPRSHPAMTGEDKEAELSDVASTASGYSAATPAPDSDAASLTSSGVSSAGSGSSKRLWSRLEGEGRKFKPYRQVGNLKVCGYEQIDFGGASSKRKTSSVVRKRVRTLSTVADSEPDTNPHHRQLPPEFAGTEYFALERD